MSTQNENSVTEQKQTKIKSSEVKNIFPSFIGEYHLDFPEREDIFQLVLDIKSKNEDASISQSPDKKAKTGDTFTIGGYQIHMKEIYGDTVPNFTDLRQEHGITEKQEDALIKLSKTFRIVGNDYARQCGGDVIGEEFITNLHYKNWFVLYDKSSFQEIHTHGSSNIFTMVYFCKVPKDLKLLGSDQGRYEGALVVSNNNQDFYGTKVEYIKPEEDKIVVFPGKFPHYTLPVISDEYRCVIVSDFYNV